MTEKVEFSTEQQEVLDRLIGDARKAGREAAEKSAHEASLVHSNEWKALADTRAARIAELEPLEASLTKHQEVLKEILKARLESLGDAAKTAVKALPKSLGTLEKLAWLSANEGLFGEGGGPVGTPRRGRSARVGRAHADRDDEKFPSL